MSPWFENIHRHDNLRERLGEGSKEKQLTGPLEASHITNFFHILLGGEMAIIMVFYIAVSAM